VYGLLADAVLVAHLAFVAFVAFGGLLVLRWRWIASIHVPAALWGITIEFAGWICPLTPLENALRVRAGETGYEGDFIATYLLPVIYPEGITRRTQVALGILALLINAWVYARVWQGGTRATTGPGPRRSDPSSEMPWHDEHR
jgi:hypothetical protein